jgi:predicted transcriptional regulator
METLARLLGGVDRVKLMRYFLHHEDKVCSLDTLTSKTKSKKDTIRRELNILTAIGFILKKKIKVYSAKGKKMILREIPGFVLNQDFSHNEALRDLLFDFQALDKHELASRFRQVGRIKLFVVSGIFLTQPKARVDVLIVGEAIKKDKVEKIIELLSAELGREVVYSLMDMEEYAYRVKMYDKFIRDVFDMPHEIVVDKRKEKTIE